jgi:hypothetical protein
MPIKVRPSEQTLLDTIANEANTVNGSGVQVQPSTPYAATIFPIANYTTTVPPASATETKVLDGNRGLYAPIIRHIGPIFGQVSNTSPGFSFVGTTTLLTYTLPENLEVARTVEIAVNGTCYTVDFNNTRMDFWVDVNGTPTSAFKLMHSDTVTHRSFCGSWIVTLPAGVVTITLKANRGNGTGSIALDFNDFVNLTFQG